MSEPKERKMLLVVDPQVDFITGSLPVPGAEEAMDALAEYISGADGAYVCKIITADRHPYSHCSFRRNGGMWPDHCIHDTVGASVWQSVFDAAYSTAGPTVVLHKGESPDREEYSIFDSPTATERIRGMVDDYGVTAINVCGLAGDICVLSTLRDALRLLPEVRFNVLTAFSPSLDGGASLSEFIGKNLP